MADEGRGPGREWLLAPVAPDEVRIHVELGEGAEVSPELRDALDEFVRELHTSEVEGFATMPKCPDLSACTGYECRLGKCQPQNRWPCAWDERCLVADFGAP